MNWALVLSVRRADLPPNAVLAQCEAARSSVRSNQGGSRYGGGLRIPLMLCYAITAAAGVFSGGGLCVGQAWLGPVSIRTRHGSSCFERNACNLSRGGLAAS